jgi:hypothetical protein
MGHTSIVSLLLYINQLIDQPIEQLCTYVNNLHSTDTKIDYSTIGWIPINFIDQKVCNTTQYVQSTPLYGEMRKHYKSQFPSFNVIRRNEPVATDTFFSDVSAIDKGSTCAQIFVGRHSLVTDVYGMKSDREFVISLKITFVLEVI